MRTCDSLMWRATLSSSGFSREGAFLSVQECVPSTLLTWPAIDRFSHLSVPVRRFRSWVREPQGLRTGESQGVLVLPSDLLCSAQRASPSSPCQTAPAVWPPRWAFGWSFNRVAHFPKRNLSMSHRQCALAKSMSPCWWACILILSLLLPWVGLRMAVSSSRAMPASDIILSPYPTPKLCLQTFLSIATIFSIFGLFLLHRLLNFTYPCVQDFLALQVGNLIFRHCFRVQWLKRSIPLHRPQTGWLPLQSLPTTCTNG